MGKKTPVLLCCLLPDKSESCQLDLEFEETEGVTFSVIGPRKVYLTGYFLGNARWNFVGDDESYPYLNIDFQALFCCYSAVSLISMYMVHSSLL